MKLEQLIEVDLIDHEGFRSAAYKDHLGYLTIGIGRMIDARRGGGITLDEARGLLRNDIHRCVEDLRRELPWFERAPEGVRRALVNMCFQMGIGSAAKGSGLLGFKNTLNMIKAGQYQEAADNALKSKWAAQTPKRAQEVTSWIRNARLNS